MQMGTCYMHLGYNSIRELLKEYGLASQEVQLGKKHLDATTGGVVRKVWDLHQKNDFTRGDRKGQDFEDWVLTRDHQVGALNAD
jgi:hypothetical protein